MTNKQIILILTILFLTVFNANAQYWFGAYPKSQNEPINQNRNFYEFQDDFNNYWGDKEITPETPRNERGGWKQYKRWEWFWEQRVYPTGVFPAPDILWSEIQQLKASRGKDKDKFHSYSWQQVGPSTSEGGYAGLGRLNAIAEDPGYNGTSNRTIWVGSASGGLWKTTDAGSNWSTNTDQLSTLGVTAIAIDPSNTSIMYIATGDGDANDTYSVGVLKSTNGGETWNTTGLNWTTTQTRTIRDLKMHPTNSTILYAATSIGVFKTTNSGSSWTQQSIPLNVSSGYWDIEINPSDPDIVFVTSNYEIAKTTNGGSTWSVLSSGLPSSSANIYRVEMTLSPANNNHLFAIYGYYNWGGGNSQNNYGLYGIYGSTNGGTNWDKITQWDDDSLNLLGWSYEASDKGGQAFYDLDILADKNSTNTFFVGGVNVWRTTNRGANWSCVAHWYGGGGNPEVHADHHHLYFGGSDRMYSGHDGGINRTTNGGNSWTWIGSGLKITQFYRFGISQKDSNMLIAGAQDNGSKQMTGSTWRDVIGGDGMECIVNYNNSNYMYGSIYYGRIYRSTNKGNSFQQLNTPKAAGDDDGAWVTPYILHPSNPEILYAGYKEIWKSSNHGVSWSKISNFGHNSKHTVLHISESNPSYIYAGYSSTLRRTTNEGSTWSVINLPISNTLTYMAVHPDDPDKIWATFSGYSSGKKVYYSSNGGAGWTNISKSLPNTPVNCITYQKNYSNRVYVGTDIGIFYIDDTMSDWEEFNDDLPNVIVNELEINYQYELIYAATYGRGVWRTSLPIQVIGTPTLLLPPNSTTNVPLAQILKWSSVVNADNYQIQISTNSTFTNIVKDSTGIVDTTFSLANFNIQYDTQYYWKVRAKKGSNTGDWSNTFNFTTEPRLLSPVLTSPSNNATGIAINANLQWNSATGATNYDVEIATDAAFNNIVKSVNSLVATTYSMINIPADYGTQYYWRLRSKSATQTSDWSNTFSFTTEPRLLPPVLTSPSNNAPGIAINANLQWNTATSAVAYDLQVASDASFNNIVKLANSIFSTEYSLTNIPADYGTQYYWRLRSKSATQTSDWSSSFNFTTEPRLLPPVLTSPSNNATGIAINANLQWNTATGAVAYDLQVASDAAFNNIVKLANSIFSTEYSLTNIPADYGTQYYWRLRSKSATQTSDWSSSFSFTTEPRLLPPVLTSPSNNATGIAINANLQWNSATGAVAYDLQVASDAAFNNIVKLANSIFSTEYSVTNIPADYGTQYYWRLRSKSATQTSDWSGTFNFTTEPRLLPPVLTSPSNNATGIAINANLQWNSATGATSYDVEIATDAAFNNIVKLANSIFSTEYSLTNIPADYETQYYWRLRSNSATQTSDWSNTFSFTTEPRLLPPVLTSPINNAANIIIEANFQWNSATSATSYDVEIATDVAFNNIVKSVNSLVATSYSLTNLPANYATQYYWRLRSKSATQTSDWSSTFNFTTEPRLLPPVLTSPSNNATGIDINANLQWNSATGAVAYDLQVASDAAFNNIVKLANSIFSTEYPLTNIPANYETQYYWRLRSKSVTQTSDWSSTFNFTTEMVLNPPDLIFPANNANNISKIPLLNWSDVANADEYRIQLADNSNFTNPKINLVVADDSEYQVPNGLLKGNTVYYWRVKALKGGIESNYSSIFNFKTENKVPDTWSFVDGTPTKSKIVVPSSINPQIGGRNIAVGDAIGIFYNDAGTQKCAGYAYWTGVILQITVWGDDPLTIEKDGFSNNEIYSFKMWDSQTDLVYTAEATYSSGPNNFQNNTTSILASLNSLTDIQLINLSQGWNMISSYIAADMPSMEDVFSEINDELVICKSGTGNVYLPEYEINDIGNWNKYEGYQVYMNQAESFIMSGTAAEPENETINLSTGWHIVSYLRKTAMDISTAIESIDDNLIIAKDNLGNVYLPEFEINTIGDMLPGQGYQIYLSSGDALTYPPNSAGKYNSPIYRYSKSIIPVLPQISGTGNSMTTVVEFDERYNGLLFIAHDDKGRLVGSAIIENGICPIVIWQDDERNVNTHANTSIQYSVIDHSTNLEITGFVITRQTDLLTKQPNDISRYVKNAVNYGKALLPTGIRMIQNIMPIPAGSEFSIEYAVAENSKVRIKLFNITGQEVAVLKDLTMQKGIYTETYSTGVIGSGEYIILMEQGSEIDTERMIIEK
jgi:hypothetical protein